MTPPIGFRTDKTTDSPGTIAQIRPPAPITDAAAARTTTISDCVYRIAALTAGIALLASIW